MKHKTRFSDTVPVSILIPKPLQEMVFKRAQIEDLSFSQLVRRAIRKELAAEIEASATVDVR
jgi:hypothetical protein